MAQAIAVGIAHFIEGEGLAPQVKWPNDIQIGGKKMAGILCEGARSRSGNPAAYVAGVGMNVNMTAREAAEIDQPATSLALESKTDRDVTRLLPVLLASLAPPLNAWSRGGFEAIRDEFTRLAPPMGTSIQVRDGERVVGGALQGFNAVGAVRVRTDDGVLREFYSGDLTVR